MPLDFRNYINLPASQSFVIVPFAAFRVLTLRLQLPATVLVLLLQRTPALRVTVSTNIVPTSAVGSILRSVFTSAIALTAVDSLAGATTLTPAPGSATNPASAKVGMPFTGGFAVIGAPKAPQSYEITGSIPPGIIVDNIIGNTVNASTVTLSGYPTLPGNFRIEVRAWNSINKTGDGGGTIFIYTIVVAPNETSGFPPAISSPPQSLSAPAGSNVTFSVTASADPLPAYQWQKNGNAVPDRTTATLDLAAITADDAGNYRVVVTNALGSTTSSIATLFVTAATPLSITTHPVSANVTANTPVTFTVAATANTTPAIQWFRFRQGETSPQALPGATTTTLNLNSVQPPDVGFYFARVSDGATATYSTAAILTISGGASRLANLSTRGRIPTTGNLTPGFVLRGNGNKSLIVRSVGPRLLDFGLTEALADPTMDLIPLSGTTPLLTNNNWSESPNAATLASTSTTLGAFSLENNSLDAAVLTTVTLPNSLNNRGYTVRISSTSTQATGIALAEVYDPDPIGSGTDLINVSALGFSGLGTDALVPGFVIEGDGAKTMLIRVVGPTLAGFGVTGTMVDPRLEIVPLNQSFAIASNDDWEGASSLQTAFTTSGAFAFPNPQSKDAAVLVRLPPGGYTVRVIGANTTTGVVLVEAYDLD